VSDTPSDSRHSRLIQTVIFAVILIALFLVVCGLFKPFFTALLWSTLLYILFSPLHKRLVRRLDLKTIKGKIFKNIWAAVFALGTIIIVLIPVFFVSFVFFRQIVDLVRYLRDAFNQRPEMLQTFFEKISTFLRDISGNQIDISSGEIWRQITGFLSNSLQDMVKISSNIAKNIGGFSLNMALIMFSLFFFYADSSYLSQLALHAIPIKKEYLSALTKKFMDITRSLFLGYILVALCQAVMAYFVFLIFRVNGALVFAALTFICVFIPMIGGGLIWLPLGIVRIASGDTAGGIAFLIVSGILISSIDNLLRPFFLKDRIQLHPLIIFFAIMGGVAVYGFNGLVMGPVLVIFFLTVLDMFLIEHKIGEQD
jgi:predicted PurR-regulated permease PerM